MVDRCDAFAYHTTCSPYASPLGGQSGSTFKAHVLRRPAEHIKQIHQFHDGHSTLSKTGEATIFAVSPGRGYCAAEISRPRARDVSNRSDRYFGKFFATAGVLVEL